MPDMLVKLWTIPDERPLREQLAAQGIEIRRALAPEKQVLAEWVRRNFDDHWASEVEVAFARQPVSCIIAKTAAEPLGFACYDATCRGFFGPTGVLESHRGKGVGTALLLVTLRLMREVGYAYAIIGGVGPAEFYARTVGAVLIEGSTPGIYRDML